jgi:hypothetical protein
MQNGLGAPVAQVPGSDEILIGRPQIAANYETIAAGSQGSVVVGIKTSAPMGVKYFCAMFDDSFDPIAMDCVSIRYQTEWDQTEVEILNGSGNVGVVFGINGVIRAEYLARIPILHQGSEFTFTFANRTGQDVRSDVAIHGWLIPRNKMKEYMV